MGTAIISCVECSQVTGLIQKVGRDSSKSTVYYSTSLRAAVLRVVVLRAAVFRSKILRARTYSDRNR